MATFQEAVFSSWSDFTEQIVFAGAPSTGELVVVAGTERSGDDNFVMNETTNAITNAVNGRFDLNSEQANSTYRRGLGALDWTATVGDGTTFDGDWDGNAAHGMCGIVVSGIDASDFDSTNTNDNGQTANATSLSSLGGLTLGGQSVDGSFSFSGTTTTNNGLSGGIIAYLVSGSTYLLIGLGVIKQNSGSFSISSLTWGDDLATPDAEGYDQFGGNFKNVLAYAVKEITVSSGTTIEVPVGPWR